MKTPKVDEQNLDGFLELVRKYNPNIDSLNKALKYVIEHWDEITAPQGEDEEKRLLREEISVLKQRIARLEEQLKEKDAIIESLREQDPKLLKEKMRIEWERQQWEEKKKLEETKLALKRLELEQKAAIEIFKPLCKSGKLPETICQGELGEFIRKSLGLHELEDLKEG